MQDVHKDAAASVRGNVRKREKKEINSTLVERISPAKTDKRRQDENFFEFC